MGSGYSDLSDEVARQAVEDNLEAFICFCAQATHLRGNNQSVKPVEPINRHPSPVSSVSYMTVMSFLLGLGT
jgi:hypothetical protein